MRTSKLFHRAALAVLLALAVAGNARAQGVINASATVVGTLSGGSYDYTITLNNSASSTDPIQTLWFAWFPGADLLTSVPTGITAPNNWTFSVQGGPYYSGPYYYPDGYSIEFTTPNASIAPGQSATFGFTSTQSPDSLNSASPYPYYYPYTYSTLISYTYANGADTPGTEPTGDMGTLTGVAAAPEPSSVVLIGLGAGALMLARRKLRPGSIRG